MSVKKLGCNFRLDLQHGPAREKLAPKTRMPSASVAVPANGMLTLYILPVAGAVVIAFFMCWAPFHSQRLLYMYGQSLPHYAEINAWMYYVTGVLYFFGSTVNPILYNLMSVKYRMAFKETLCGGLSPSSAAARAGFREQSSFRDTSVHQVRSVTQAPKHWIARNWFCSSCLARTV